MARRIYPWEEWFGRPETIIVKDVHYHCSQSTMCQIIRNNASVRAVRVKLIDGGTDICIRVMNAQVRGLRGELSESRF